MGCRVGTRGPARLRVIPILAGGLWVQLQAFAYFGACQKFCARCLRLRCVPPCGAGRYATSLRCSRRAGSGDNSGFALKHSPALIRPPLRCSAAPKGGPQRSLKRWVRLTVVSVWFIGKRLPDDWGDSFFGDAAIKAVLGLQPNGELLLTFARIASAAAKGNVLSGNDRFVVDDVLPTRGRFLGNFGRGECVTAIDTTSVSSAHFDF